MEEELAGLQQTAVVNISAIDAIKVFKEFDKDGNGLISRDEFVDGVKSNVEYAKMLGISEQEIREGRFDRFGKIDCNASETLDVILKIPTQSSIDN